MSLGNSKIKELVIELLSQQELKNFVEIKERLESLNISVGPVELRTLIAELIRERLISKELATPSKKFVLKLIRP